MTYDQYARQAYVRELRGMIAAGLIDVAPGKVTEIVVAHDGSCDIWQSKPCNCDPSITYPLPPRACADC